VVKNTHPEEGQRSQAKEQKASLKREIGRQLAFARGPMKFPDPLRATQHPKYDYMRVRQGGGENSYVCTAPSPGLEMS
jgi:hypothetical protein